MRHLLVLALLSAPGDYVYYDGPEPAVVITAAQAAALGQWAIDVGAWAEPKTLINEVCGRRDSSAATGFSAAARGRKRYLHAAIPLGCFVEAVDPTYAWCTQTAPAVAITGAQAALLGQWSIDIGAWGGLKSDIQRVCGRREQSSATGFIAEAIGRYTAAPADLPLNVEIVAGPLP